MEKLLLIGGTGHLGYAIINEIYNFWKDKKILVTVLSRNNNLPTYFPVDSNIHFRRYDPQDINTIKDYIKNVSKDKNNRQTNADHLHQVAKERGYDRIRPLVDYINTLVKKGKLPKELAAEYEKEINTPIDEGK